MSSSVPRLEKISLNCTEEADSNQPAVGKLDSRRRSLISLNSNMKPEIVQNKENIQPNTHATQQSGKMEDHFRMPDSTQLVNLRKILHEKMQNLLQIPTQKTVLWETFTLLTPPITPISGLKGDLQSLNKSKSIPQSSGLFKPYKSPLLHFRAYRFSPFFRTKENMSLSSQSFSHKLNPKKMLCQYDLQGTCNDQECKRQHVKDYTLSNKEVLQDIVSYAPALCAAGKDLPAKTASCISDYVDNVLSQNQGRITLDQLCLLQVSKVNEFATHVPPHTMFFEPRFWRPTQEKLPETVAAIDKTYTQQQSELNPLFKSSKLDVRPEWEDVVRYFDSCSNSAAIHDLEAAVLEDPHNEQLWMKLSYKKLSGWDSDQASCHLDQALNVLARGLENNKQSSDLWQYYLQLYSQHQDSQEDLLDMCRTAIQNAPSYSIWWQNFKMEMVYGVLSCEICGKYFYQNYQLTNHMRKHTGEKPFHCEICGRDFSLKGTLTAHMRTHTGEKPYHCEICGKDFSQNSKLTIHMRTHTGEKPYHCEICGKDLSQKSKLTNHMRTHTGEKPYHCEICGKDFTQSSVLTRHMRTHTGEKPYHCEICGKDFTQSAGLTKHMRTHDGEKPFQWEMWKLFL